MHSPSVVAAARNDSYTPRSVRKAVYGLLENANPPLSSLVKSGKRVLVKVNMGCTGAREPSARLTTHPLVAEAVINAIQDCGASVCFGDDSARAGKYYESIYRSTGMLDVARRTGATLVDFVAAGAREVRGRLLYPRRYLVTNAYFDADIVINAASCRSHVGIGLSGAMKNMFGFVVGRRKQSIHSLLPGNAKRFGKTIADIYRTIPAQFSVLDLTTVAEAAGITLEVRPVGLILGSADAVALDTVASHAIGYQDLPIWPSYFGGRFGIGCNVIEKIEIRGVDWPTFQKQSLRYPFSASTRVGLYDRATAILNNTLLRPRPVIHHSDCQGCGDCVRRCPVNCIDPVSDSYRVDLRRCVDCGCCLATCERGAIHMEFTGFAKAVRRGKSYLQEVVTVRDPAPMK